MSRGDGGGLGGRGHGKGSRTGRGRAEKASKDNQSRQLKSQGSNILGVSVLEEEGVVRASKEHLGRLVLCRV